jgi:hypothetical protein
VRTMRLPALRPEFEPTRETLHAYARAVSAVPRAHAIGHPKWWHISLEARPEGLVTDSVPLPGGETLGLRIDVPRHEIVVRSSSGFSHAIDMRSGATGTEMADEIIEVASALGLEGTYERSRFEDDGPRAYEPPAAEAYFAAFTVVSTILERRRATLGERAGPVQVWPHGFDMAFEWFGGKTSTEGDEQSAQVNLGFYPGDPPYFYSSPWPFDDALTEAPLPHGAVWNTEGWKGAMLPYDEVRGGDASVILSDFGREVFEAALPTLPAV